jgi:endoglucanase
MRLSRTYACGTLVGASVALSVTGSGCLSSPSSSVVDSPVPSKGCAVEGGTPPATAPMGYYTNGATVCAADGTPHQFHGVDRPSLEWGPAGANISLDDFQSMARWGANVVRIALNQDFWLAGAALNDSRYPKTVADAVHLAEAAGLDVILDLHWSDAGDLTVTATDAHGPGHSNQQEMADSNSIQFWKEVADKYKGDGRVLFELYNEPNGIPWDVWLNGGQAGHFVAAGMQQLYDAVRGTGANNVVIAGGLDWAYDLSAVGPTGPHVHGYNVIYATHPYTWSGPPSAWEGAFAHLVTTDFAPVIATEFGDGRRGQCTGNYDQQLIAFTQSHGVSWTAWAWYPSGATDDPQGCAFPSLILDWNWNPSVQGVVVKAALQNYASSMPPTPSDAGAATADDGAAEALAEGDSTDGGVASPDDASPDSAGDAAVIESAGDALAEPSDEASDADMADATLE